MKQTTKNMQFYGRKNKTAKDLYPYPAKWRSIASQSNCSPHEKAGARWLSDSCRVPVFLL